MKSKSLLVLFALALIVGCASSTPQPMAMVVLNPISGSTAHGTVHFQDRGDGTVEAQINLVGLTPGVHGFHIHDKGDCGDNGNAAGGHFNPMNTAHGAPDADPHHAGDFGNVTADAQGNVVETRILHGVTAGTGATSIVGHALIVHANPDDLTTQPSGNAGPRVACGVIEAHVMQH